MQTISEHLTRSNRAARRRALLGKVAACAVLLAIWYYIIWRALLALSGG